MKKIILALSLVTFFVVHIFSATVTVEWDKSCDTNVVGYYVKWGYTTKSFIRTNVCFSYTDDCGNYHPSVTNYYRGIYTNNVFVSGYTNTTCTISNLLNGVEYAFVCTKTNKFNLESDLSEEVTIGLLPSVVKNFRLLKIRKTAYSYFLRIPTSESETELYLTWNPNPEVESITKYRIEYQKIPGSTNWLTFKHVPASTNVSVITVTEGKYSYKFRIFAVNSIGVGTNNSNVITYPTNSPLPIISYSVTNNSNSITVSSPFLRYPDK